MTFGLFYQLDNISFLKFLVKRHKENWHDLCFGLDTRASDGPQPVSRKEVLMSAHFANLQNHAVSFVGALVFAALMISAAVPVLPVA